MPIAGRRRLPTIGQQAVDAVIKNDYTAPAVDPCYAGILANMFGTRTVEPESASGIEASVWSESLSGSTISGDLARLMNPRRIRKRSAGSWSTSMNWPRRISMPRPDSANLTAQYAAATVTTGNAIGTPARKRCSSTPEAAALGRALMNVSYDLATGHSVVQVAIPTKSLSNAALNAWNVDPASMGWNGGVTIAPVEPVCFAAGTPILLADGTTKLIELFEAGDEVRAHPTTIPKGRFPLGR